MVDDHTQRPFRSNEAIARGAPAKVNSMASPSGTDPLAELARLIGQNDPFAEYGRDTSHGATAPRVEPRQLEARQPEPRQADRPPEWLSQPAGFAPPRAPAPSAEAHDYYDQAPPPLAPAYGRQQFGGAPLASDADLYQVENDAPGYPPAQSANFAPSFADDQYSPRNPQLGAEQEDFYDDVPPSRRRMGILVIAGVFALAVIGTAGAFGYRAVFGTSSVSKVPPVIKAESTPSKVVPAATKDTQSGKQITDRVNDKGMGEKLVSREEQPVALSGSGTPDQSGSSSAPAPGSGVVGSEPKKVRTIAIRPDQPSTAEAPAAPTPTAATSSPPRVTAPTPKPTVVQTTRVTNTPPPAAAEDPEPAPAPRQAAPRAVASSNAPLSLNPDAPPARAAPARAAAPMRTAAVPAAQPQSAAVGGGPGGYAVQVSSQRSEAEAQAAFRSLQSKYPAQLGGKQSVIRRADLGAKGIYFRAMVPLSSSSEASELCNGLKAAGGSCIVQKN